MKREELWAAYVAKNPAFATPDAEITLTARGLKKMFEQTYDQGFKAGVQGGLSLASGKGPFGIFERKP